MDITEFKKQFVKNELQITEKYGRILSIIDFGNVNHWFESDRQDSDNKALADDEKFRINLQGLRDFSYLFSQDVRLYYGTNPNNPGSINFISALKSIFGKHRIFSKQIQFIKHHLQADEVASNKRATFKDGGGTFIRIPKCNFDVEICVDAIRLIDSYDTLVLFSSDADFVALSRYLRNCKKKVILIKGGNITQELRKNCDLVVSAQNIKKHIASIERQKPGV